MLAEEARREAEKLISRPVLYDEPMSLHTSMGVGGTADAVFQPANAEELKKIISFLKERGISFFVMGNGTNLIVKDGGYRGAVVSLKEMRAIALEDESTESKIVRAEAGASLSALAGFCASASLAGLEFCTGIPGTVGGAVKMNAGAYGREMKDVVEKVRLLKGNGEVYELKRGALRFEYRKFHLAQDEVIVGAFFRLAAGNEVEIKAEINRIQGLRKNKHPLDYRSAGSIFKNPRSIPAGRLIEEAGLKGMRVGDAQVSEKHANFIVNVGEAAAADVLGLIALVKNNIQDQKGILLEEEVVILGED